MLVRACTLIVGLARIGPWACWALLAGLPQVVQALPGGIPADEPQLAGVVALKTTHETGVGRERKVEQVRCTGTLVAPSLVLTAARCVAPRRRIQCDLRGEPVPSECDGLEDDACELIQQQPVAEPGNIEVYGDAADETPLTKAARVHLPDLSLIGCMHQVALIELAQPLALPVLPLRLDEPLAVHESIEVIGYGESTWDSVSATLSESSLMGCPSPTAEAVTWHRNRLSASVLSVGPGAVEQFGRYRGTFLLDAGGCRPLDLGGPVLDGQGRVVGLLFNRLAQGEERGPCDCFEPPSISIATHLPSYSGLIFEAFAAADETLPVTPHPGARLLTCRLVPPNAGRSAGGACVLFGSGLAAAVLGTRRRRRVEHARSAHAWCAARRH